MLEYRLSECDREVVVRSHEGDLCWPEVVEQIVVFLHACGYVFEKREVEECADQKKEEIELVEAAKEEGVPF